MKRLTATEPQRYRFVRTIIAEPSERHPDRMLVRIHDSAGKHTHSVYWPKEDFDRCFEPMPDPAHELVTLPEGT